MPRPGYWMRWRTWHERVRLSRIPRRGCRSWRKGRLPC